MLIFNVESGLQEYQINAFSTDEEGCPIESYIVITNSSKVTQPECLYPNPSVGCRKISLDSSEVGIFKV